MRLDAGHGLNLERAEYFIGQIAALDVCDRVLEIDLSQSRYVDPGSGWRLGNALRRACEKCEVIVRVPEDAGELSGRRWFQSFTKSGLGHALARYAHQIVTPEKDITEKVRSYYSQPRRHKEISAEGLEPYLWGAPNFIYITDLDEASLDPSSSYVFANQISKNFGPVDLNPVAYGKMPGALYDEAAPLSELVLSPVVQLFFEAVQNCYDHCKRAPLPRSTTVSSYLSIQYHRRLNYPRAISSELPSYIKRVRSLINAGEEDYSGAYIEVVINDDGVGIPARLSLQSDISEQQFDEERNAVLAAINTSASVKPRSRDSVLRGDPGLGFVKIVSALKSLNAFAAIRTGRVLAYFDATAPQSEMSTEEMVMPFQALDTPLGCMPGTNLQVIFPHRELQRMLPLDARKAE